MPSPNHLLVIAAALTGLFSPAELTLVAAAPLAQAEQPVVPERNPPGDIPDNQVFIDFNSPAGFSFKVPQGWARQDGVNGTVFTDKYDGVAVSQQSAGSAPTSQTAQANLVPALKATGRAVTIDGVDEVSLPAGKALRIAYHSNSAPNPVTNKAVRLESQRFYFWRAGMLVSLDLSAPAGADNVDQWQMMSRSFHWQ